MVKRLDTDPILLLRFVVLIFFEYGAVSFGSSCLIYTFRRRHVAGVVRVLGLSFFSQISNQPLISGINSSASDLRSYGNEIDMTAAG